MDAYFLGVNLFGVERQRHRRGPARPVGHALPPRQGHAASSSSGSRRSCGCSSRRRSAAGLAIKNFFEGVGCEIASWFGSDCKDRMVDAEVTQQENVDARRGFTIPIATFYLPKLAAARRRRPSSPRKVGDVLCLNVGSPRGNRGVEPDGHGRGATRSRTSAASPAPRALPRHRVRPHGDVRRDREHRRRLRRRRRRAQRARGRVRVRSTPPAAAATTRSATSASGTVDASPAAPATTRSSSAPDATGIGDAPRRRRQRRAGQQLRRSAARSTAATATTS